MTSSIQFGSGGGGSCGSASPVRPGGAGTGGGSCGSSSPVRPGGAGPCGNSPEFGKGGSGACGSPVFSSGFGGGGSF